jgi:hypothetical protein
MNDITRRNKAVPVQASRVPPQPEVISIPGAGPIPVPQPQHGQQHGHQQGPPSVTQNIIYVNVPAGQAAPPPSPPQQPSEVHVHTHVHQYPRRRRSGRYGVSFLGTLGFVLGGVACGAAYVPQLIWLARPIALAAGGCAGLGLISSIVLRKAGRGMPLLGLISAGLGYWMWMIHSGQAKLQLPKQFDAINNLIQPTPATPTPTPATPAPTVVPDVTTPMTTPAPTSPAQTTPAPTPQPPQDHSIFGDHGHWGDSSKAPPTPATATPTTPSVAALPAAANPAQPDVATATTNLENARVAAAQKLGLNYTALKTAANDARAEYEQIRQASSPGSPELISASQARMDADARVLQMQAQLRSDPSVAAAEAALKNAKAGR